MSISCFLINPQAPAFQRQQGCRFRCNCTFINQQLLLFKLSGYSFMSLEVPSTSTICTTKSRTRDPFFHKKTLRFQACLQGLKKQKKKLPRHPQNTKIRSRNSLKTISITNRFLQYISCENNDLEVPDVDNSS